ncbi:NitT/TauT family transport system ATP-binding protein [Sphingomonas laterariae]|uniref:NitT/TauT family transport system ATP-binding protein n=2 Tax=Edaphosphingomonas laterariae TaxID=861865 RepID=A0A239CVF9_9SPHN|nr:NitT/TauT family transport system ATP-binding protein [Sphingomonas laterariae]
MGVAIRVENLTKYYGGPGGTKALEDVDIAIDDCEFISIIGPSGCGKSTLLRVLAGLHGFDTGSARMFDAPIDRPRDDVGVVFQTSNLLPWATVRKNLTLAVEIRHGQAAAAAADVAGMIDLLNLNGFEDKYPHELSGGMKHRVAIGQALMQNPRVLLMDEPFGALDALTRDRLNVELLRLWQRDRKTVVLITHSIAEAVLLSDRVLVLSERPGRLIANLRIDLPRPRDPSVTRDLPAFGDHVVELSRIMGVV